MIVDHLYESKNPICVSFEGKQYYNDRRIKSIQKSFYNGVMFVAFISPEYVSSDGKLILVTEPLDRFIKWAGMDVSPFSSEGLWRKYNNEDKRADDKVDKVSNEPNGPREQIITDSPIITDSKNLWDITDFADRTIKDFEKEPECRDDYKQMLKEARRLKPHHTYESKKPTLAKGSHTLVNDRRILAISADGKNVAYCDPTHEEITVSYKHFRDWAKKDITDDIFTNSPNGSWRYWQWFQATQQEGYISIIGGVQSLSRTYLCKSHSIFNHELFDDKDDNDESKFFHKNIIAGDWLTYIPDAALDNKDDKGVFIVYAIEKEKFTGHLKILGAGVNTFRQGYVNPKLMRHVEFNERVELIKKVKNNAN